MTSTGSTVVLQLKLSPYNIYILGFHAQLVSRFDNISSRQNALRMRIISIRDGLEFTAITDCEKSIANEAEDIIKAKRALENATYPLADKKARLVNLAKILRINIPEPLGLVEREIDGDLGTVAELLTISNALPKMLQVPIFSLLAPYLGIRVCESNDAARRLLQYIDKSHLSCRIWVISRLQSANQRSVPNSLLQKFGSVIIDPKAHVTGAEKVIGKIFTNWVILKDAQYLQTLLHEHVNCVTLDGYKHTLGSLTLYSKREAEDASLDTLTAFSATMIEYRRCLAHSRECEERVRTKDARLKYFQMNLIKLREVVTADADYNELENELNLLDQQIKAVAEDIETARVLYSVKEAHVIGLKGRIDSIKSRNLTGLQLRLETVNNSTTHLNNLLAEQTILFGKLSDATTMCHQLKLSIEEAEYLYKEHFEESKLLQAQLEETASSIKSEEIYLGNCTYEQTQCRLQIEALEVKKSALVERVSSDKIRLCGLITKRDSLLRSLEENGSILSAADYRCANENVDKMSADNLMVKIASVEKVIVDFQVQKKFVHSELMQTKATIKHFAQNHTDDLKSLQKAVDTRFKSQQIKLEELQHRSSLAGNGILVLEKGLEDVRKLLDSIHRSTFELLRSRVKVYFKDLVPGKMADLGLAGDKLEDGLKFVLYNHEEDERKEVQSLSGGEKSLLGLTFIFASALHKRSPLYLLDEVDAALDEGIFF